ncbi:hypothetical protein HDU96_008331 [Phlyctochytrium bullatum]|nr:hypothetical protein HDU96_008331 [Phlyctochytrium bullatum]
MSTGDDGSTPGTIIDHGGASAGKEVAQPATSSIDSHGQPGPSTAASPAPSASTASSDPVWQVNELQYKITGISWLEQQALKGLENIRTLDWLVSKALDLKSEMSQIPSTHVRNLSGVPEKISSLESKVLDLQEPLDRLCRNLSKLRGDGIVLTEQVVAPPENQDTLDEQYVIIPSASDVDPKPHPESDASAATSQSQESHDKNEKTKGSESEDQVVTTTKRLAATDVPEEKRVKNAVKMTFDFSKTELEPVFGQKASPGSKTPVLSTDTITADVNSSRDTQAGTSIATETSTTKTSNDANSAQNQSSNDPVLAKTPSTTGPAITFNAKSQASTSNLSPPRRLARLRNSRLRTPDHKKDVSGSTSTSSQNGQQLAQSHVPLEQRYGVESMRKKLRMTVFEFLVDEIRVAFDGGCLNLHDMKAIDASGKNVLTDLSAVDHVQLHPSQYLTDRKVLASWDEMKRILQSKHYYNIHTNEADGEAFVSYRLTNPVHLTEVLVVNRHVDCMERITRGDGGYVELRRCGITVWKSSRIKEVKPQYCFQIDKLMPLPLPFSMMLMPQSEYHGFAEGALVHDQMDAMLLPITGIKVFFQGQHYAKSVVGFEIIRDQKGPFRLGGTGSFFEGKILAPGDSIARVTCGYYGNEPRICFIQFWIVSVTGKETSFIFGELDHELVTAVFQPPEGKSRVVGFYGRHSTDFLYGLGVFYG